MNDENLTEDFDLTADDELDLTGEGLEPQRANFQILEAKQTTKENGILAEISFKALDDDVMGYPITETFWLEHKNPNQKPKGKRPQDIGRGMLKRLFTSVYGQPSGSLSGLQGRYVSCWLKEDQRGFATVGSFQKAEVEEEE